MSDQPPGMNEEYDGQLSGVLRPRRDANAATEVGGASIRPATKEDAEPSYLLFSKHLQWIRSWFPKEQIVDRNTTLARMTVHMGNHPGAVAEVEGKIVGFICSQVAEPDMSHISNFYVDDAFRGRGIGTALVQAYERLAVAEGYSAAYTTSSQLYFPGKLSVRVLFARLGYDVIQVTERTEMYIKRNIQVQPRSTIGPY
jgi:GNAT superfamily N-acetyltransferase